VRVGVGLVLLASAFAPLVALLAVLRLPDLGWIAWLLIGLSVLAVGLLLLVLKALAGGQVRTIEAKEIKREDERVLRFMASYIVPLVVAAFGGAALPTLLGTAGVVLLLALLYVRGQMYHLNPVLSLLGYRLYEVKQPTNAIVMVLSRRRHLRHDEPIRCRFLTDDVAFEAGHQKGTP
jgi:Mn2+/Fe2+ NRAMP family transporter